MLLKSLKGNITCVLLVMMILLFVPQQAYAEQVNGEYTIQFNIMHADKKNASIAEGYWNQPATVYIQDDSIRVQTTINKHAWVTKFAVNYNGHMSEVKTISVDEAANSRVTEFQVANLTDLVESDVSVTIEEIDYEHSYTMYFKFKPETLTLVKADESAEPDVSEQVLTEDTESIAPAEGQEGSLTPTPDESVDATEQSGSVPAPQIDQSDEVEVTDATGETGSDDQASDVTIDVPSDLVPEVPQDESQREQDASEASVTDETTSSVTAPVDEADEQVENSGNGNTLIIVIVVIIVLIGIMALAAYRARQHKK